jgi:hypothetical protein
VIEWTYMPWVITLWSCDRMVWATMLLTSWSSCAAWAQQNHPDQVILARAVTVYCRRSANASSMCQTSFQKDVAEPSFMATVVRAWYSGRIDLKHVPVVSLQATLKSCQIGVLSDPSQQLVHFQRPNSANCLADVNVSVRHSYRVYVSCRKQTGIMFFRWKVHYVRVLMVVAPELGYCHARVFFRKDLLL